ncbi:MAG TPA: glycine oxidase ThiO [Candidatus Acidoferrales bacterium]|nr:glycine oxidase ThiO [Candidatus Acidoferrales bacterium]
MPAYDVAIIGGGIIGSSIAWELARNKLRVVVLDRQQPGLEASWAAAGILSAAPESPGAFPMVSLGRASLGLYPEFVAAIEEESRERVGFRPKGTLQAFFARDAEQELSTLIALHHGLGLAAEALRTEEARELEPSLSAEVLATALRPEEASVDNRALTRATILAAQRAGVEFRAPLRVNGLLREENRCSGVATSGERIAAGTVVLAAGCFSGEIAGGASYAPVRPARGQMVALRAPKVPIERVLWSERVYIVPRDDGRLVAGSTVEYAGFEKGLTAAGLEEILSAAIEIAPALKDAAIEETWSGLRPDSPDHLPILGTTDLEGFLVATGHFRSGILLAPITAKLIREWITEKNVSVNWEAFSPLRFQEAQRVAAEHTRGHQGR